MINLNLTRDDVEERWGTHWAGWIQKENLPYYPEAQMIQDWLTLYDEVERLNKALEGAMEEINERINSIGCIENPNGSTAGYKEGLEMAYFDVRRHFGIKE